MCGSRGPEVEFYPPHEREVDDGLSEIVWQCISVGAVVFGVGLVIWLLFLLGD
jgi:hypothetical protein